jgi:phosphoribosylaminoimidazole-succinocarboxamide synthase
MNYCAPGTAHKTAPQGYRQKPPTRATALCPALRGLLNRERRIREMAKTAIMANSTMDMLDAIEERVEEADNRISDLWHENHWSLDDLKKEFLHSRDLITQEIRNAKNELILGRVHK